MRLEDSKKGGEESGTFLHRHGQGGLFGDDFAGVDALPVLVLEDADGDLGVVGRVDGQDAFGGGEPHAQSHTGKRAQKSAEFHASILQL